MRAGALHSFTNGSQSRRRARRERTVLSALRSSAVPLGMAALAAQCGLPGRTVRRYLKAMVERGEVARSTLNTCVGVAVLYRAVRHG
jgi:DNA-binding IclR family transcriptional regulator